MKHCKDLHLKLTDNSNLHCSDIDGLSLYKEIKSVQCFLHNNMIPLDPFVLNYIYENNLCDLFPNISIFLRIYLSLPVTVASAERSFSKLKKVKNYLRSIMSQERLSKVSTISIEHEILDLIDTNNIITKFSGLKARKVNIL